MKFDQPSPPEVEKPKRATERLESGELSEFEQKALDNFIAQSERFGVPLDFANFDGQTGQSLDVLDNAFPIQEKINERKQQLGAVAFRMGYVKLSSEDQATYQRLVHLAPEELKAQGEDWRKPSDILEMPNIDEMSQEDLEKVMVTHDNVLGSRHAKYPVNIFTGAKQPDMEKDKGGYLATVLELSDFFTKNRHAIQEAARLQREKEKFVAFTGGGISGGEKYLEEVKERLGA